MTHYQQIHLLKQELRRNRLFIIEQKNHYEKIISQLRREILKPKIDIRLNTAQWCDVMRIICQLCDITPDDIYSNTRVQNIVYARHLFSYLCRKELRLSLQTIGRIINRDHSSIINAVRKAQDLIDYDKQYRQLYKQTIKLLGSYMHEEPIIKYTHTKERKRDVAYQEEI
jgi:chromosomal replication initiation ATPase DnaA